MAKQNLSTIEQKLLEFRESRKGGECDEWTKKFLVGLNSEYKKLRENIRNNRDSITRQEYSECLAYHFYNLTIQYQELYVNHSIDLRSAIRCAEYALKHFKSIPDEFLSDEAEDLHTKLLSLFDKLNQIYNNTKCKILESSSSARNSLSSNVKYLKYCIALGDIDDIDYELKYFIKRSNGQHQKTVKYLKNQIFYTELIRIAQNLENELTIDQDKEQFLLWKRSLCLGYCYKLAGQDELYKKYLRTAKSYLKKFVDLENINGNSDDNEYQVDEQDELEEFIRSAIEEKQSSLIDVKKNIEENFGCSTFSNVDEIFIEQNYIKICLEMWYSTCMDHIKIAIEDRNENIIKEVLNAVDNIQNLNQIPESLKRLKYFQMLSDNYRLIARKAECDIIRNFKNEFLVMICDYSERLKYEFKFFEAFCDFLNHFKTLSVIVEEIELEQFCCFHITFTQLAENICKLNVDSRDTESLELVKKSLDCLKSKELFMLEQFHKLILPYTKKHTIETKLLENRYVIEVVGKNIISCDCKAEIEENFVNNSKIEEVRFIATNLLYMNCDFKQDQWHGKNVVVFAKTIEIDEKPDAEVSKYVWNLSGLNGTNVYSSAGVDAEGDGKNGRDGNAGESGGNVLIIADHIINGQQFVIISNGGDGGRGQNGGDGKTGPDGKSLSVWDFKDKFPPPAKFFTQKHLFDNIRNLECMGVHEKKWDNKNFFNDGGTDESRMKIRNVSVYMEGTTPEKNHVKFSFYSQILFPMDAAFLLFKGSLGQPGGKGGENGLGGQGGFAGEIKIYDPTIEVETSNGKHGENGLGGQHGKYGSNGWDLGYMDYSVTTPFNDSWPKYHGLDENSTLKVVKRTSDSSDRVYCAYPEYECYVEIERNEREKSDMKNFNERNTRKDNKRQQHANAIKKKSISESTIQSSYSQYFNAIDQEILDRGHMTETRERALDLLREEKIQEDEQTINLHIRQHRSSDYIQETHNRQMHLNKISMRGQFKVRELDGPLLELIKNDSHEFEKWVYARTPHVKIAEFDKIFQIFQHFETTCEDPIKKLYIKSNLIKKYRFTMLQQIEHQIYPESLNMDIAEQNQKGRWFKKVAEDFNKIGHINLGALYPYIITDSEENRDIIVKHCTTHEVSLNGPLEMFIKIIGAFTEMRQHLLKELNENKSKDQNECDDVNIADLNPTVKKFYKEYKDFSQWKFDRTKILLEELKSEIKVSGDGLYDLWLKTFNSLATKSEFETKIGKHPLLKQTYETFTNSMKSQFDWSECVRNAEIREEFEHHIRENGFKSPAYRELLAEIFDAHICVFSQNDCKQFQQLSDHNRTSSQETNILACDTDDGVERFVQLQEDEQCIKLYAQREVLDMTYKTILANVNMLDSREEMEKYFYELNITQLSRTDSIYQPQTDSTGYIDKILKHFSSSSEQYTMKDRLFKISSKFIEDQHILQNITSRFDVEGRYITANELYNVIDIVLSSYNNKKNDKNLLNWIIMSYSQDHWTDELTLYEIENYCRYILPTKTKFRRYLEKIPNKNILLVFQSKLKQLNEKNPISLELIENIFYLLSNIKDEVNNLQDLALAEWPSAIKEDFWMSKLISLTGNINSSSVTLSTACYYILHMENIYFSTPIEQLLENIQKQNQSVSAEELEKLLLHFYNEEFHLNDDVLKFFSENKLLDAMQVLRRQYPITNDERDISILCQLIRHNKNSSENLVNILETIENMITNIKASDYPQKGSKLKDFQYEENQLLDKSIQDYSEPDIRNWVIIFKTVLAENPTTKATLDYKILEELLAVINRGIELKRSFRLRDTQNLAVLCLLLNVRNTLAQVSTGEGKSLIVVAAALIKVLCGEKVDIITSSSVLAKRDAECEPPTGNRDIYDLFDINVSHNCSDDMETRKIAYSQNQVIYGDLSSFQRDFLLDRFYQMNVLGDRTFENVIIDEVDSMLLDKGNNMLYLSHDLCGFDQLESVYLFIWQWVNRPAGDYQDFAYNFDVDAIKAAVLYNMYGTITKSDVERIDSEIKIQEINRILSSLTDAKIIDKDGKLLVKNFNDRLRKKLDLTLTEQRVNTYRARVFYLIKETIDRDRIISVPNYLRSFIEEHVECWINSAISALSMKEGYNYVVDINRRGHSTDINPNIIIIDNDTGTDQTNSQWDNALHQFLQLKHGCKISMQSLKAVFVSNVSYFKLYDKLYGLTGTLGSKPERELLQEIHSVDFVTIPTAKSKKFREKEPILCENEMLWLDSIVANANKMTIENDRSVLIICETVDTVKKIYKAFGGKAARDVYTYTRDYEEFVMGQGNQRLEPGKIIIATNLAGRGTDIKISETLRQAGGLHICLTYLPNNSRIEQQALGRAARCGDSGSGQLIIMNKKGYMYGCSMVVNLKHSRNQDELHRISKIKEYYEGQIMVEEECFNKFQTKFLEISEKLSKKRVNQNTMILLMQSILDRWAFWLDKYGNLIPKFFEATNKRDFYVALNTFLQDLSTLKYDSPYHLSLWVKGNPVQSVKLATYFVSDGHRADAIGILNDIIDSEEKFSHAAHYFKAYAFAKDGRSLDLVKRELEIAKSLFEYHNENTINMGALIDKIRQSNTNNFIQINAYVNQKKSLSNLFYTYINSINEILGRSVEPETLCYGGISDEYIELLFSDLLENGVLLQPKVTWNRDITDDIKNTCSGYGISCEILTQFLNRYKNQEIDMEAFLEDLEKSVRLASRERFWNILVEKSILRQENQYIIVDTTKLNLIDQQLFNQLNANMNRSKTFSNNDKCEIFLYGEQIENLKEHSKIFLKSDIEYLFDRDTINILSKLGVFSTNKRARICAEKLDVPDFTIYDTVSISDFLNEGITKEDATVILTDLLEQGILKKDEHETYRLTRKYDPSVGPRLKRFTIYENSVKSIFALRFIYRIAWEKILLQLEDKATIRLPLVCSPHNQLMVDLIKLNIVSPVRVNSKIDDFKTKLNEIFNDQNKAKYRHRFQDEQVLNSVERSLEKSQSLFEILENPSFKTKPLDECFEQNQFGNSEEIHQFDLNGLEYVLQVEEQKWTLKMWLYSGVVILMGIGQIVIGALIEMYSVGAMTHVGAGFINEGINDIFFAIGAIKSGYFSWKDYGRAKIESILLTIVTVGVGAYLSRGVKLNRYGYKIAGSTAEFSGKKVSEMSGKSLFKAVSSATFSETKTSVWKAFGKRIGLKTIQGITYGCAHTAVDSMAENYMQQMIANITSTILATVRSRVNDHVLSNTLELLVRTMGVDRANQFIDNVTRDYFGKATTLDAFLPFAMKLVGSITSGIIEASKKLSRSGAKLALPIKVISETVKWSGRTGDIQKVMEIIGNILDHVNNQLVVALGALQALGINNATEEEVQDFRRSTLERWNVFLNEKIGQIISTKIVVPILKQGAENLVRSVGKSIENSYRQEKENKYFKTFEKLKDEYKEQSDALAAKSSNESDPTAKDLLTKQYQKELLILMSKTRDSKLFASIIREDIPMDFTCVNACTLAIPRIMQAQGIPMTGLTIVVENENGLTEKFSSGNGGPVVKLKLGNQHYENANQKMDKQSDSGSYDCLFQAVSDSMNLNMNAKIFRTHIANCIEHDPKMVNVIHKGYHQFAISHKGFGGAKKVVREHHFNVEAEKFMKHEHRTWKFNKEKDVDLRDLKIKSRAELNDQLKRAFESGLNEINSRFEEVEARGHNSKMSFDNFKETKWDVVMMDDKNGNPTPVLFPVEFAGQCKVKVQNTSGYTTFDLKLDLDNPNVFSGPEGPHGPHVGYEVRCNNPGPDFKYQKIVGHVLLNKNGNERLPGREGHQDYYNDVKDIPKVRLSHIVTGKLKDRTLERHSNFS